MAINYELTYISFKISDLRSKNKPPLLRWLIQERAQMRQIIEVCYYSFTFLLITNNIFCNVFVA